MTARLPLIALILACAGVPALADGETMRIRLRNGDAIRGVVLSESDTHVVLKTPYGILNIPHRQVAAREALGAGGEPAGGATGGAAAETGEGDPSKGAPTKDEPKGRLRSVDKETLGQIQQLMVQLQDAINRGDGARLGRLLEPPRSTAPLGRLKELLGVRKVIVRAIHARSNTPGVVRATVNITAFDLRGDAVVRGEVFTLVERDGEWRLQVAELRVSEALRKNAEHEVRAIATLRAIHKAQRAFVERRVLDLDNDDQGEHGFLQELAGARLRGAGGKNRTPIEPLIDADLGRSFSLLRNYGIHDGYHYTVYLPGDRVAVAERGPLPGWLPVHANRAEVQFVCYAWPAQLGLTGQRAFVIDRSGAIHFTTSGRYFGANLPAPEAAFSKNAFAPKNLLTDPRYGLGKSPTCDEQDWHPLGQAFMRRMPPGKERHFHLLHRLLLAEILFPKGPLGGTPEAKPTRKPPLDPEGERARQAQALKEVRELLVALQTYYGKKRSYPPSGGRSLVTHLDGDKRNGGDGERYYHFPVDRVADQRFLDPWGHPYLYQAPEKSTEQPRVWSSGPDGRDDRGAGDDILAR